VNKQSTEAVRGNLEKLFPEGISLEQLTLGDEKPSAEGGRRFRIRTTEQNQATVSSRINQAFPNPEQQLVRVTLDAFVVEPITEKLEGEATRFAEGQQTLLKFSGPLSEVTVLEYVSKELASIMTEAKRPKYESVQVQLLASGVDSNAGTKANPKYTDISLRSTRDVDADDVRAALNRVQGRLAALPVFEEVNAFDTSVANQTKIDAILAIIASLVMIVGYMWFRFEKVYFGYAAVAALAHDVLVTVGCLALGAYLSKTTIGSFLLLEDFKINLNQIACLLTIVGYSLNDTIVIFDRIREIKGKSPKITPEMINLSVNQTLSRTLLTALTTLMVVVVLYVSGGSGIHGFAFSMIVGVITGCYSTVYIANPVLLWLVQREEQRTKAALVRA
jgi:SecD/SecF fusion protein